MIRVIDLHKTYGQGTTTVHALKGIDFEIRTGEFIAIMGRSGSGKSTLLHMLGLLDKPTAGAILIEGKNVGNLSTEERAAFRLEELGYVFQEYSLLSEMTLLENVCLPTLCLDQKDGKQRAIELLERVGLGSRLKHYPNAVSGGEQQRAAIARALINRPKILFADEPTASLDVESARVVLELFRHLNEEFGQTIVMVTHEPEDRSFVDRVLWLKNGELVPGNEIAAANPG